MKKVIALAALLGTFSIGQSFAQQTEAAQTPSTSAQGDRPMRGQGMRNMTAVEAKDLPAAITASIKEKYPDATVRRTGKDDKGLYHVVVVDKADARTMLVYDEKGTLTEERQMPARQGGRGEGRKKTDGN